MAAVIPLLLVMLYFAINIWNPRVRIKTSANGGTAPIAVEDLQKSLAEDRRLLLVYEKDQSTLRAEVIRLRKSFQDGQIGKDRVVEAEQSFVAALKQVHELRYKVTEADIAITEAILGEKVLRLPVLAVGGFTQTAELTRFNGSFKWSIKEAPRIEKFFAQTFGRRLPVTAMGQSQTHNLLGFDHRDSIDVGIHPDSDEGRTLINYLRSSNIPFLAFRQAVPGTATGPHVHIGRPSVRVAR
jgi:hypothetical protein